MKNNTVVIVALLLLVIIGVGGYFVLNNPATSDYEAPDTPSPTPEEIAETPEEIIEPEPVDETPTETTSDTEPETVIGTSVDGEDITAYHFGDGNREVLFVGGIHGGYSPNTALVAYELIDYLDDNPNVVPDNVRVTVIPVANPDGLMNVAGTIGRFDVSEIPSETSARTPGRFNANDVDLNRNFDCEWQAQGTWQTRTVSGGNAPFSEPESMAIRNFVNNLDNPLSAAVVWYSAAGGVYSSTCDGEVSPETSELTNLYANASGYPAFEEFDYYEITGDMVNWLAKNNVPAISVLLTDHTSTEWSKNRAGIEAVLNSVSE